VVNICTPPFLHEEMTVAAAEAGKHVKEPLVNGIEGRKSLEIVRAIYKSGKASKPIKFPVSD